MKEYLEMPWSVEDTIHNMQIVKKFMQGRLLKENNEELGVLDAKEAAFDFDRAIEALEKQMAKKVLDRQSLNEVGLHIGSCPICKICHTSDMPHCYNCGQKLDWTEE